MLLSDLSFPGLCLALCTKSANELGQWENSAIHMLTHQLSTQSFPPLPNCYAGSPHPYQRVSRAPNLFLLFSSSAQFFLSQPFS